MVCLIVLIYLGLTPSIFYSVGNIRKPKLFWNPPKSMINFNRTKSVKFSLQVISRSWTHEDLSPAQFIMVRLLSGSVTQKSSHHPLWRHTNSVFRSQKGIQQQQCRSNGHQIFPSSQKREEKKAARGKTLKFDPFAKRGGNVKHHPFSKNSFKLQHRCRCEEIINDPFFFVRALFGICNPSSIGIVPSLADWSWEKRIVPVASVVAPDSVEFN